MPDQRSSQPPSNSTEEPEVSAQEYAANPSADGGESVNPPIRQPRAQIRAAINSIYGTRLYPSPEIKLTPPSVSNSDETEAPSKPQPAAPDPDELRRAAEIENLIAKAQLLARQGQLEEARNLLTQAVQRDSSSSEAWTWLGGLLVEVNLERARLCLTKALELDTTNERARRGLAQIEERQRIETELKVRPVRADQQLARIEPVKTEASDEPETPRPLVKIGIEEAVENLRQSGKEANPENIPLGGAKIRPAVERGELTLPKVRRRRKPILPKINLSGFRLSMTILALFLVTCLAVLVFALWPSPEPSAESLVTPEPTSTPVPLTSDETFAAQLRGEMDRYARSINTASNLRQQVQKGKLPWEDYRRSIRDIQSEIKNEKKPVDNLAPKATPKLIPYYREFQNVVASSIQGVDFTMSGIENTNPEDLEEGNRQFNEAGRRLGELTRKLNQASPIPTPVPSPTPRPTSAPTATPQLTPDTTAIPALTPGLTTLAAPSNPVNSTEGTTATPGSTTSSAETTAATVTPTAPPATPTP